MAWHLASLWNQGSRQLWNALLHYVMAPNGIFTGGTKTRAEGSPGTKPGSVKNNAENLAIFFNG